MPDTVRTRQDTPWTWLGTPWIRLGTPCKWLDTLGVKLKKIFTVLLSCNNLVPKCNKTLLHFFYSSTIS